MKKFKIIFSLLIVFVIYSCESNKNNDHEIKYKIKLGGTDTDVKIVVIDSCEYLYLRESGYGLCVLHKGNCKYCIIRNNK